MDETTAELRDAHDELAELYAERLADSLDRAPVDRAVLGLFCDLLAERDGGAAVGDIGCGSGRMSGYLARRGPAPHGIDLSPEMVRVARRDHPGIPFEVADLRRLPFADGELSGVLCWYSLMYLPPAERPRGFAELARVVRPGGLLATAFKLGDDRVRRGGRSVGVEFDVYWLSMGEMERRLVTAGFRIVFRGEGPPSPDDLAPPQCYGYVVAERG
ncbi:class I SAM-dependent methyltransferase [Pseudonocardia sp.]|uniref:class I SAM-dependent methyltransferase n=1 Tax=Pseudonocardia sp. TaxID=60912 RepID=UPI00260B28F4|nr:class I SAM-dependent methyltransferase [Pseudonocardia sp.]